MVVKNETLKRALTGLIYIGCFVTAALLNKFFLYGLFLILGSICIYETNKLLHFQNLLAYFIFGISLTAITFFSVNETLLFFMVLITILIKFILMADFLFSKNSTFFNKKKHLITLFYIIPSFLFIHLIPISFSNYEPWLLIGFLLIMWVNDSFAYLIGKHLGKTKLFERISPKKTVEGFIGGFVFALTISYFISHWSKNLNGYEWMLMALIISISGSIGDLVQSRFKRLANVKDSGNLIPGHGGIFDRMDSTLFSSSFVFAYLFVINHVS